MGNTLVFSGIDEKMLDGAFLSVTVGQGRKAETVVEKTAVSGLSNELPAELNAGTEYNIQLTIDGFQPISLAVTAE